MAASTVRASGKPAFARAPVKPAPSARYHCRNQNQTNPQPRRGGIFRWGEATDEPAREDARPTKSDDVAPDGAFHFRNRGFYNDANPDGLEKFVLIHEIRVNLCVFASLR